ncbi:hypothetical protein KM043_002704 [Ampulex compressa]|nr:hypothetical protein KM043_002704 [Ampulex compressa]
MGDIVNILRYESHDFVHSQRKTVLFAAVSGKGHRCPGETLSDSTEVNLEGSFVGASAKHSAPILLVVRSTTTVSDRRIVAGADFVGMEYNAVFEKYIVRVLRQRPADGGWRAGDYKTTYDERGIVDLIHC